MTKTLGLIGAGMIGGTLARLAVAAGLDVLLSNSRGPETHAELLTELGPQARAATPESAARNGDLVVVAIPLCAYDKLPVEALAGKTVIDTMNYYPDRDGHFAELDSRALTSSSLVQRHLAHSRVVKAFNNISFFTLATNARPAGSADRSALPVAGDDPAAKTEVVELLDVLGYDAVDIGTLTDSWRFEPGTSAYVKPYLPKAPKGLSEEETWGWIFANPGGTVPADLLKRLTDTASRVSPGAQLMREAAAKQLEPDS